MPFATNLSLYFVINFKLFHEVFVKFWKRLVKHQLYCGVRIFRICWPYHHIWDMWTELACWPWWGEPEEGDAYWQYTYWAKVMTGQSNLWGVSNAEGLIVNCPVMDHEVSSRCCGVWGERDREHVLYDTWHIALLFGEPTCAYHGWFLL